MSTPDLTADELAELADWMEENVAVHIAPGVELSDVDYGLLDPSNVRHLSPADLEDLDIGDALRLKGLISSWQRWENSPEDPDGPVYTATLGVSPWRERRRTNPPTVPAGRDDLVWMEWETSFNGQFHRAIPDEDIPVVGGAESAVLTTEDRARSLDAIACPNCFPDESEPFISITDETGLRRTINTDAIDTVPQEVLDDLEETVQDITEAQSTAVTDEDGDEGENDGQE